jgi:hypothetical protein
MGVIEQRQLMVIVIIVIIFVIKFVQLRRLERRKFWRWLDIVVRLRSHE